MRTVTALVFVVVLIFMGLIKPDKIEIVVGGGSEKGNGPAAQAKLDKPFGVGFDKAGNLYFVEMEGNRVCKVDKLGLLTVIAGTGEKGDSGDGGPANTAKLNGPHHLLVEPNGDIYVADTFNCRVRKIEAKSGRIIAFAGTGKKGFSGDGGLATQALFGGIYCLAFDPTHENLYLDDLDNRRIRKVSLKTGIVSTAAGNGERGIPTEGSDANSSPLLDPRAIAIDKAGNLYILERSGCCLRRVNAQGKIRTVVGTGNPGPSTNVAPARDVTLRGPKHLCIDRDGTVLIADTDNHAILRYSSRNERVTRIAGTGTAGSGGVPGDPTQAELNQPHGVFVDTKGILYISDSWNDRILKISR